MICDFAGVACGFCELLRGPLTAGELAAALVELHRSALRLPALPSDGLADMEIPELSPAQLPELPFDLYWLVADPLAIQSGSRVAGSLADDLSDIRADLLRGLAYHDAGRTREAYWEWRFHFHAHWGRHLVNAQQALFAWQHR